MNEKTDKANRDQEFAEIARMINSARNKAIRAVNKELITLFILGSRKIYKHEN